MNRILSLYTHCVISRGNSRSSIIDLQRYEIHLISNQLCDLFSGSSIKVDKILKNLDDSSKDIFNEYVCFLESNELVFWTTDKELKRFPRISEEWLFPAHISNCILDTNTTFNYFNDSFLSQVEKLCCNYMQFRFYVNTSFSYLQQLMDLINPSQIKSVEIAIPQFDDDGFYDKSIAFTKRNPKISNLIISATAEDAIFQEGKYGMGYITKISTALSGVIHCGIVHSSLFVPSISHYTESLAHNTCLNRKIAIDLDGNIKNCPSMKESFGNIKDTTLEEAINKPGFKKHWNITKDQIIKCKDCEFRHICTDCRAYIDNPDDVYSAPLKCGYNPYTCEWEEWSTNPLKQQSIEYYGMQDLVKKES